MAVVLEDVDDPVPGPDEVVVDVVATALNRADLLQRMGLYPDPRKRQPEIPGLEFAGTVGSVGERVTMWQPGDRVMGIEAGGAYAERIATHERQLIAVPDSIEALVELPGVGRKTANLVLIEGFAKPAMCVDTHVHRISNLWGLVETATPEETEHALRRVLPRRYWLDWNRLLVSFGQHTCVPLSPRCSACPIEERCPRIGVARWR